MNQCILYFYYFLYYCSDKYDSYRVEKIVFFLHFCSEIVFDQALFICSRSAQLSFEFDFDYRLKEKKTAVLYYSGGDAEMLGQRFLIDQLKAKEPTIENPPNFHLV